MSVSGQVPPDEPARPAAGSVAVKLDPWQKNLALALMFLAFGFGSYLAYKNDNGVGTAAVFAVGLILLIAGFGGVLPTSLKVGDVEVAIQQARQQGAAAIARMAGADDPAAAGDQVRRSHPELAGQVDDVQAAMRKARKVAAAAVANVALSPDPQAAARQVGRQHPDIAPEAAKVAGERLGVLPAEKTTGDGR